MWPNSCSASKLSRKVHACQPGRICHRCERNALFQVLVDELKDPPDAPLLKRLHLPLWLPSGIGIYPLRICAGKWVPLHGRAPMLVKSDCSGALYWVFHRLLSLKIAG
jgi:hypothetical protein